MFPIQITIYLKKWIGFILGDRMKFGYLEIKELSGLKITEKKKLPSESQELFSGVEFELFDRLIHF